MYCNSLWFNFQSWWAIYWTIELLVLPRIPLSVYFQKLFFVMNSREPFSLHVIVLLLNCHSAKCWVTKNTAELSLIKVRSMLLFSLWCKMGIEEDTKHTSLVYHLPSVKCEDLHNRTGNLENQYPQSVDIDSINKTNHRAKLLVL